MLRILVVDDEKLIRKGIVKTIGAMEKGYTVIGEAANGIEALEIIKREKPDVVITDIKMPKMDGVQLITNVDKSFVNVKKIVLSGFDEFNYVRAAMKNGASDYLLKPVDFEQLGNLLEKIENDIKWEQEKKTNMIDLKIKLNQSFPLLREQFIHEIICEGKCSAYDRIKENLQYFNIHLSAGKYQVIIVSIDDYRYYCEEIGSEQSKINLFIKRNISEESVSNFTEYFSVMEDIGLVIACSISESNSKSINLIADKIYKNLTDNTGLRYTISVGKPANRFEELKDSYDSAFETLKRRFYLNASKVIVFDEEAKNFNKNNFNGLMESYQTRLKSCVDILNEKQIQEVLEELCTKLKEINLEPSDAIKVLVDIFTRLQVENVNFKEAVTESYGFDYSYEKSIILFDTLVELKKYTSKVFTEVIGNLKARCSKKDIKLIEVVKEYILKHYNEDITLSRVADTVYVNPNYLSEVFKAQTGESFVDYFTRIRIEKAKELIKNVKSKTYTVGELVGYDDPAYFSKVFKKVVGVSPTEYRNLVR